MFSKQTLFLKMVDIKTVKITNYCKVMQINMKLIAALFFLNLSNLAFGQDFQKVIQLKWETQFLNPGETSSAFLTFAEASTTDKSFVPQYVFKVALADDEVLEANLVSEVSTPIVETNLLKPYISHIKEATQPSITYTTERKKKFAFVAFHAIYKENNAIYKRYETAVIAYQIRKQGQVALGKKNFSWKNSSLLNTGDWVKLLVNTDGVYKLTQAYLNNAGLNLMGVSIDKIRMYGYGAGILPEHNAATVYDDLEEIAIYINDLNNNGIFDASDEVWFYGEAPDKWQYDNVTKLYRRFRHFYSDNSGYFITIADAGGKRITQEASAPGLANYTSNQTDACMHFETDKYNLLKSGKEWFGFEFDRVTRYNFSHNLPGLVPGTDAIFQSRASGRAEFNSNLLVTINGTNALTQSFDGLGSLSYESLFATSPQIDRSNFVPAATLQISYNYPKVSGNAKAWLDYYEIIYRRSLSVDGQLNIMDSKGVGAGLNKFLINSTTKPAVWEVSKHQDVKAIDVQSSRSDWYFQFAADSLRSFVAFNGNLMQPAFAEKVNNQNLHSLRNIDYVMVSHPEFLEAADELAAFHTEKSGLSVKVVTPSQIYNEFSSGIQDVSAIRNFLRMLYDESAPGKEPKFLLLFGDASYDYKDINPKNTNFVPTYQTLQSTHPVFSICADDYFALMDEDEGNDFANKGSLDLGVGRMPVTSLQQAKEMVAKVKRYAGKENLGNWRNEIYLFGDDQDGNVHLNDCEFFSGIIESENLTHNIKKVYSDAYKQVAVGNGHRYPDVSKEFNNAFNDGALVVNYSGHGGEVGLGHEILIDVPQINSWKAKNGMPLFITATCGFSRFDDLERTSAGELTLLNPEGGAIALFTTVRLVYSYPNRELNSNFYRKNAFKYKKGTDAALGSFFMRTKNATQMSTNNRSFTLLGDPALELAFPEHKVITTEINGNTNFDTDTLRALSMVEVKGRIENEQNMLLQDFNGVLDVKVFAEKQSLSTLGQDADSYVQSFNTYNSIIYKGKASVTDGLFTFSFVMPLDMSIENDFGKISYYAHNGTIDAHGHEFVFMSPEIDPKAIPDNKGPLINLFMNDTTFRFGGITDENPSIYALVYDESGINTTGIGIGRDISGVLNEESNHRLIMNNNYTANLDDFRRGVINYPLSGLREGKHTLKVKVWDIHNNSSEAYTEFVVAKSSILAIENLLNYPNPFSEKTNFRFEHNKAGEDLQVSIGIFDLAGNKIKQLDAEIKQATTIFEGIEWLGDRDGASKLSSGVYIYRINVRTKNGQEVSQSQRLVYINQD